MVLKLFIIKNNKVRKNYNNMKIMNITKKKKIFRLL